MDTTLFIEFGYQTGKIALYNHIDSQFHHVDITGGYGKRAIPLHMHYIREDHIYLIGEDAIHYEADESTQYFKNVLDEGVDAIEQFIQSLLEKIEAIIPNIGVAKIILLHSGDPRIVNGLQELQERFKKKNKDLQETPLANAIAAWFLQQVGKEQSNLTEGHQNVRMEHQKVHYFDEKYGLFYDMSIVNSEDNSSAKKVLIEHFHKIEFPLKLIDEFYINYLQKEHKEPLAFDDINRLYHDQMITLFSQLTKKKEVSIYSSLEFPPIRIKVSRDKVIGFLDYFKEEYVEDYNEKCGIGIQTIQDSPNVYSGAHNKKVYLDRFLELSNPAYEEHLVLEGALLFHKHFVDKDLVEYNKKDLVYGVTNKIGDFLPLSIDMNYINRWQEIGIIVTGNEEFIEVCEMNEIDSECQVIQKIMIDTPSEIKRLSLKLLWNEQGQIKEVKYEFRDL